MPELNREDLWILAYNKGRLHFKDFSAFCGNNKPGSSRLSRQTMANYLKILQDEGKLKKALADDEKHAYYYVPQEQYTAVDDFIQRCALKQRVDKLSRNNLEKLRKYLEKIERINK